MLDNTGVFVTDDLNNIVNPVTNETFVFLTTDGQLYAFNGVGYDQISGGGAGSGITQLTGDVTAGPGSGSEVATIAAAAVTLAKIANAAANSKLVGSGASGAGAAYSEITLGTNLSMSGTTLNAATGGGGGGLTLVETQTLTGDATSITFSGLDGNTDGVYKIVGWIKVAVSNSDITLKPNNVTSNQGFNRLFNGGNDAAALWSLDYTKPAGSYIAFSLDFQAKCNPNSQTFIRTISGTGTATNASPAITNVITFAGIWTDTSTNLTSLVLAASQTNGLANGSTVSLYKYEQ